MLRVPMPQHGPLRARSRRSTPARYRRSSRGRASAPCVFLSPRDVRELPSGDEKLENFRVVETRRDVTSFSLETFRVPNQVAFGLTLLGIALVRGGNVLIVIPSLNPGWVSVVVKVLLLCSKPGSYRIMSPIATIRNALIVALDDVDVSRLRRLRVQLKLQTLNLRLISLPLLFAEAVLARLPRLVLRTRTLVFRLAAGSGGTAEGSEQCAPEHRAGGGCGGSGGGGQRRLTSSRRPLKAERYISCSSTRAMLPRIHDQRQAGSAPRASTSVRTSTPRSEMRLRARPKCSHTGRALLSAAAARAMAPASPHLLESRRSV